MPEPTAAGTITIALTKDRETKGTWRYVEDGEADPVIGQLYVKRRALARLGNPDTLTVTITA